MRISEKFQPPEVQLLPNDSQPHQIQYNAALSAWLTELLRSLDREMSRIGPSGVVPRTTLDAGSAIVSGTATQIGQSLTHMYLPSSATSTSATPVTALSYTGRGVLQRVIGISQIVGTGSTAAGMTISITIDGVLVSTTVLSANNQLVAALGYIRLQMPNTGASSIYGGDDDPNGLPFNESCLIEYSSATAGQGVTVGWRVLKKL